MEYKPIIDVEEARRQYSQTLGKTVDGKERILMTGHSHRAWPDVVAAAQMIPVELAFSFLDKKWYPSIFGEIIPEFQGLTASRIGTANSDHISHAENTHELVTRVLSCFPWDSRTRLVSTDSEFHSLKRQLYRLQEERVRIDFVSDHDKKTYAERITDAITSDTTAVLVSTVFFNDGAVLSELPAIITKARQVGAIVVLDAYHHYNVRRLDTDLLGSDIFITAGGYKYASAGEGAAWLKVPKECTLRPRITGWFSDFDALEKPEYPNPVVYGNAASRFSGATRDISGLCRQIAALKMMDDLGWTVDVLEANTAHQTSYLIELFDELHLGEKRIRLVSSREDSQRGPFLSLGLETPERAELVYKRLWDEHRVLIDTRGAILRLGPAPYTTGVELEKTMEYLNRVLSQ